jgi:hypothetical protein
MNLQKHGADALVQEASVHGIRVILLCCNFSCAPAHNVLKMQENVQEEFCTTGPCRNYVLADVLFSVAQRMMVETPESSAFTAESRWTHSADV